MRSKAWKELSKRADNLYPALCNLEKLSTDELRGLRSVCGRVTNTNCSWVAYRLAPMLAAEVNGEFMRRANARKQPQANRGTVK